MTSAVEKRMNVVLVPHHKGPAIKEEERLDMTMADFDAATLEARILPRITKEVLEEADEFVAGIFELLPAEYMDGDGELIDHADNDTMPMDEDVQHCLELFEERAAQIQAARSRGPAKKNAQGKGEDECKEVKDDGRQTGEKKECKELKEDEQHGAASKNAMATDGDKQKDKEAEGDNKGSEVQGEGEQVQLELLPRFHLEPVPDTYLPDKIDFEAMTSSQFRHRFHEMRQYMQARRKALTADAKQKRRQQKRQSKRDKIKQHQLKKNVADVLPSPVPEPKASLDIITPSIVMEVDKRKPKRALHPKQALQKLQQQQKPPTEHEGDDEQETKRAIVKKAFKKAVGERLQDNVHKLKKAVKRREKQKQRSSKTWQKRLGEQKQQQRDRQERRQANLDRRREHKSSSKRGRRK